MYKTLIAIAAFLLEISSVDALQCNGCRGCGKRELQNVPRSIQGTGLKYAWVYGYADRSLEKKEIIPIVDVEHGGEYIKKPKEAIGVHLVSGSKDVAIAGWFDKEVDQPWNFYAEHGKELKKIYYFPEGVEVMWAGLL